MEPGGPTSICIFLETKISPGDKVTLQEYNETDFTILNSQHLVRIENNSLYLVGDLPAVQFADFRENETYKKVISLWQVIGSLQG